MTYPHLGSVRDGSFSGGSPLLSVRLSVDPPRLTSRESSKVQTHRSGEKLVWVVARSEPVSDVGNRDRTESLSTPTNLCRVFPPGPYDDSEGLDLSLTPGVWSWTISHAGNFGVPPARTLTFGRRPLSPPLGKGSNL